MNSTRDPTGLERTTCILSWFHPTLNPPAYIELAELLVEHADVEVRRRNRRAGNQFQDVNAKLEAARFHAASMIERLAHFDEHSDAILSDLRNDLDMSRPSTQRLTATTHVIQEFRDHKLIAHMESLLTQTRSALDSLAQFYSIAFGRNIRTFSKKGKPILKDLQQLKRFRPAQATALEDLVLDAKKVWLDALVDHRDSIVHYGQLQGFLCKHMYLTPMNPLDGTQIRTSCMPDGEGTAEYAEGLLSLSHAFAADWLRYGFDEIKNKQT